jgi:hypothetical protein
MKTVIVINNRGMGHGSRALGLEILQTFFNKTAAFGQLDAVVFYNSGVKVVFEGSDLLPVLSALAEHGIDLVSCGTCVHKFAHPDKVQVGRVGSMDDIVSILAKADKVITL